jgi:hypothetical protein
VKESEMRGCAGVGEERGRLGSRTGGAAVGEQQPSPAAGGYERHCGIRHTNSKGHEHLALRSAGVPIAFAFFWKRFAWKRFAWKRFAWKRFAWKLCGNGILGFEKHFLVRT